MAAIDNVRATAVLQGMLGVAAFPVSAVAPMWIRLITANAGIMTANGTEAGGAGYVAGGQSGNFGAPTTGANGPTSQGMTAAAALSWTAGANWVITGFEIWDNAGTKLRWWFGTFTGGNVTVNTGQVLQIATNAVSVSLS